MARTKGDLSMEINLETLGRVGGQSNGYPIGYKPTGFVFKEDN